MATRTQVAIIGGGPAGLLLSHMLHRNGIDSIVLERESRNHVLERIRAGVLEAGTVELLREVGLGARMDREGHPHNGSAIAWEGRPRFFIDTKKFTGKTMMAYGQTAITEDLYAVRDAAGGQIIDETGNVRLHALTSSTNHSPAPRSLSPVLSTSRCTGRFPSFGASELRPTALGG
jgi:p-hydroxybenzoate 3-monooxygenase